MKEIAHILSAYGINATNAQSALLSGGLINATWKVSANGAEYIVQRVNTNVFRNPQVIAANLDLLSSHLAGFPDYLFAGPVRNLEGASLTTGADNHFYRLFPYIRNSYTLDSVSSPSQAFEAASQFGKFTYMLRDFNAHYLGITIPDFHNITLRYRQFLEATENGNPRRIDRARLLIRDLQSFAAIADEFEAIRKNNQFQQRVTHHDTKISNVLFNREGKGLCVIDLDTVMPGYFFSDVGDMMRTYLSPATEEETDFSRIEIRVEVYKAVAAGYLNAMKDILTTAEHAKIFYSGTFMIYMQALRFATDFLNNDIYYGARYPEHNFNRASNQLVLLKKFIDHESKLTV